MRILLVVPTLQGGGAEFVAATWAASLAGGGDDVHLHTISTGTRPDNLPAGVRWHPGGGPGRHVSSQRLLRRIVDEVAPDVVLALQMYPNLHVLGLTFRRSGNRPPVVISERNLVSLGLPSAARSHRAKVAIARRLYRRADRVVAISHPVAAEMVSGFAVSPGRCVVVPNPATAKLATGGRTRRPTPGDTATAADVTVVLPCRLVTQKRPLLAVDVVAEIVRRGRTCRLLVFGSGPLEDAMRERAARAGVAVDFRGWDEHWFRHCPAGSVMLSTSDREGFGNTLVEAAAAGIISVAYSGALGVADAVVPGVTGELTLEDSPAAFADAIERTAGRTVAGVDGWLARFGSAGSVGALRTVLSRLVDSEAGS